MLEKSGFEIIETLKLKNGYIFDYHIIFAKKSVRKISLHRAGPLTSPM